MTLSSIIKLEQILRFVCDFKLLERLQIFLAKCFLPVMLLLVHDLFDHDISLTFAVRECAITFLPLKFSSDKFLFVDPFRRIGFYFLKQIGDAHGWRQPEKYVDMVTPSADR